ncbi:MAG: fluoride efflux transporter CrcB [Euryarchaeota archaeon]|nr:fluoride efflux transporter CrcB [Euryarchaeota archaeon]
MTTEARIVLLVALGGALGALLRYGTGAAFGRGPFPYATLVVNVVGSFLLALLLFHDLERGTLGPASRAFFAIGLLGAFTTMSTFSHETLALWLDGRSGQAVLNIALNIGLSIGAVVAGRWTIMLIERSAT